MSLTGSANNKDVLQGNANSKGTMQGNAESSFVLRGNLFGLNSVRGYSAYEVAVINGFRGTVDEWLESLKGDTPIRGVDYWTEEDKAYIIEKVSANLLYPASVE